MSRLMSVFTAFALLCVAAFGQEGWTTSYEDAIKASKKTHKPVLAYFTGSDWCGWCHRLDKEVFDTPGFQDWASRYVILLQLDYPHHAEQSQAIKRQNGTLLGKFKITGFPTVHLLNADGVSMAKLGYQEGGPAKWVSDAEGKVNTWLQKHPEANQKTAPDPTEAYDGVPYEEKKLYAKTDLRGKEGPAVKAEEWLTGSAPKTRGKVVLIDLWATWCPPCRELIPELATWSRKFRKDLVVVGITNEAADVVKKFMKDVDMPYNVGIDTKSKIGKLVGVEGIPHVLVISADGIVRWQGFPQNDEDPLTEEKLAAIIAASKEAQKDSE